ncbi:MAG: NUDIX hydrolase [Candidatus Rokubacteria bacterium]|nr:NUDIX hydrolase [Candidatus Rokubacteria bacterium]
MLDSTAVSASAPPPLSPDSARFCPLCGHRLARQPIPPTGKLELVCSGCRFIYYLDQKVVAGTLLAENGRILLTRRSIHPSWGKWTFPGGYVDWGEAVDAGAIRETREETGLEVAVAGLVGVYSYPGTPVVVVVYRGHITGGTVRLCHENDRAEWVPRAAIPWDELAFPSTRAALRDFLALPCPP